MAGKQDNESIIDLFIIQHLAIQHLAIQHLADALRIENLGIRGDSLNENPGDFLKKQKGKCRISKYSF
jgi:hypothetical protein